MIQIQPEDLMNMFGMEYKMVTIVGIVRNITHSSTKITYDLEDLTGTIAAHFWIEENEPKHQNIMINSYVRVVGAVRAHLEVKSIMLFKIQPVSGINEVNTHYLEVINARYVAEEYSRGGDSTKGEKMDVDMPSSKVNAEDNLQGKEGAILALIRSIGQDNEGLPRSDIHKQFPKIPGTEIDSILDRMVDYGHIYTTLNADMFQACY